MDDFDLDLEERYLRQTLAQLQKSYNDAARPYIDRLVQIARMRIPRGALYPTKKDGDPPSGIGIAAKYRE